MLRFRKRRSAGQGESHIFPPTVFTDANYTRGILIPNATMDDDDSLGGDGDDCDIEEVSIQIPNDYFGPDIHATGVPNNMSYGYREGNANDDDDGGQRSLPILSQDESALWNHNMAAHAAARRRFPMQVARLLGTVTLVFDEKKVKKQGKRALASKKRASLFVESQKYSNKYNSRIVAKEGVARRPVKEHDKFMRNLSKKQALAEAGAEMGIEEDAVDNIASSSSGISLEDRTRLEARAEQIFEHWKQVKQSPPLRECWNRQVGGFVREAIQTEEGSVGDDGEHFVPIAALLTWLKGDDITDRAAGRTSELYNGLRHVPTDAKSILESLEDLSCTKSLYKIPLITPYAVARRIDQDGSGNGITWKVRIGVYMNRLLPEILTNSVLHRVMSALDEDSYIVSEPLHLPPMRDPNDPVFKSSKYPIVKKDAMEVIEIDLDEEEKKEDDEILVDAAKIGATRECKTISPFTPKGLLKLMENTGNDISMLPQIELGLSPYLKLDLMPHQQHAVCWMTQMEQLGGFGINSIIWEEREFLDGGKYYYSPALGQIRLGRPPVTCGGCVADEMGLGKTLQMLSLIASSLNNLKTEAREGGKHYTHATLIIVPPALVMQWVSEIKKSCGDTIAVNVLDANKSTINHHLVKSQGKGTDILITTYSALEKPKTSKYLANYRWGRIVLDEQQEIRSSTTTIAKNCEGLDCHRRWMLSGTPIFEGIDDLRGELNFLRLVPYAAKWEDGFFDFSVMQHWNSHSEHGLETLRILGLTILRRSKDMTICATGQSIMEQRRLTVEVVPIAQSASERALYCWFEFLVSLEIQRKNEDSDAKNQSLKSRALCLRLLREICFTPVMINGGLGVASQIKTLNDLFKRTLARNEQQKKLKQTNRHKGKKQESTRVMSCEEALRFLSQELRDSNVSEDFVSEQQFSRAGGGATSRARAMESIQDQVQEAHKKVDEATRKQSDAKRKRAKARWHLALELMTTGTLSDSINGNELMRRVSPKFSLLWKWRRSCINKQNANVTPCLQRGWRPSSSFAQDLLRSNPRFAWLNSFALRLDNIPPQVTIDEIKSAIFEATRKEPRARLKLEKAKRGQSNLQSDITNAEKTFAEAITYDQQLQSPTVVKITNNDPSSIGTANWMAYVIVTGEEAQKQIIRIAESSNGIVVKSKEAIPHIQATLETATESYNQSEATHNVHPCVENKKEKTKARKALVKARAGLTINFDSASTASTKNVLMSHALRNLRGIAPRSTSALVDSAYTAIAQATDSLGTACLRLEDGQSTLARLTPALSSGVSEDVAQKSAYDTLESLRKNDFEETRCPICIMPFGASKDEDTNKPVVAMTNCGHFFCISCLDDYVHREIGKGKAPACPNCRATFNPSSDVMHIDHLANDDEEKDAERKEAKAKVCKAAEVMESSEGVLGGDLWKSLFLSIDVPTHVSRAPHHMHTSLPSDVLAHIRAATEMKAECARTDEPLSWRKNSSAGISSKIQALLQDLPIGEHAVVFSSSKEGVLHLATVLKAKCIDCFSLYIGQHTKVTEEAVSSWSSSKVTSKAGPVLVVQAGAAASGLTLTAASKVFLMEPFTRQEEENQAFARCHRYGQLKDVHVKIYSTPVSVESRLLCWRKRSEEKMDAAGNSSNYVFAQLFDDEEKDSDVGDEDSYQEDMFDEATESADEDTDAARVGEENLRTRFLLGLVDEDGNPTDGNELDGMNVDQQDGTSNMAAARRFILN